MTHIVKDFLLQLTAIATVVFVYQIFLENRIQRSNQIRVLHACSYGLAILLCMSFRAPVNTTLDLDIRIVPLLLGTLYGGWRTGIFLSVIIVLYRFYLALDLGFVTTLSALLFGMPVFAVVQKVFMKANRHKKIQIAVMLVVYYNLVGLTSVYVVGKFSRTVLWAALIQISVDVLFVSFFVYLSEMIKETITMNRQLQSDILEAEIAFLRAQIKPHFLYNALNSISALCDFDPKRAGEVTDDLAHYLRSRFDFGNMETSVPLNRELEYVTSYINVEKARFGDRLMVEYQIEDNLELWIPPLVLQPIVENAVKHGLKDNQATGLVRIAAKRAGEVTEIRVSDNGKGINPAKIEQVLTGIESSGVGLTNVNERLMKRYGTGLSIISEPERGTTVVIKIPGVMQR